MDGAITEAGRNAGSHALAEQPLFRPQVLAEQQTQWLGTILLKPRPAHRWFAACALLTAAAVASGLFLGSYTKTARVTGFLVPEQGVVRVFSQRGGVATRIFVREGDQVAKGQPLLALSTEEQSAALGDTQASIARTLAAQRESLKVEKDQAEQLLEQQRATLTQRLAATASELESMGDEIALQKSRLALAKRSELRQRELQRRGFISEQQLQAGAEARLDQAAKLRALERTLITLGRERLALAGELKDLPLKLNAQIAGLTRSIALTGREMAEVEARRELIIPAPQAGIVTAILAGTGAAATPGLPLLSIVPRGAKLEAHLFAPSRSMGFVRTGQPVLLRYQAYPYQKFGHYRGVVASISRTGIGPAELPAQFAGAGNAAGAGEALYRITVVLARQDMTVYGKAVPLQAGMQLEADVLLERRRLYEWLLDPVYTLTGK